MPLTKALLRHIDARTDPRAAGLVRIAMGLVGMLFALVTHRDVLLFSEPGTLRFPVVSWEAQLDPANIGIFTGIALLVSLLFALGFYTRVSGSILIGCIVYRHFVEWGFYQNYTVLLGLFTLCLILGNAGAAWSIDAKRRGGPMPLVPLWPQTLIKYQISVVYFYTALGKMNAAYFQGDVFRANFSVLQPFDHPLLWESIAYSTIILELWLAFSLWMPRLRPWAITMGTALHIGILFGLGFYAALIGFSTEFISVYLLFVAYSPGAYLVIWDDGCSFCRTWTTWFRRLDWLGVLRFEGSSNQELLARNGISPEEADREIKVLIDGRVFGGFEAVRKVLGMLPLTLPGEPVLRLPPIRSFGHWAYRRVAERRKCMLPNL